MKTVIKINFCVIGILWIELWWIFFLFFLQLIANNLTQILYNSKNLTQKYLRKIKVMI